MTFYNMLYHAIRQYNALPARENLRREGSMQFGEMNPPNIIGYTFGCVFLWFAFFGARSDVFGRFVCFSTLWWP